MGRFIFTDLTDSSTAAFIVNPDSDGSPALKKTITSFNTVASNGKIVLFEGAVQPAVLTLSGWLEDPVELTMFTFWGEKKHQIQMTDDLGRNYLIIITDFVPQRVWRGKKFYRHTYTLNATIVNWP